MAAFEPLHSQASVAPGAMCRRQSMRFAASYSSREVLASIDPTLSSTRVAARDHRHVR